MTMTTTTAQQDVVRTLDTILAVPGLADAHWNIGARNGRQLDGRLPDGYPDHVLREQIHQYADALRFTVDSQPFTGERGPFTRLSANGVIDGVQVTVWVPIYPQKPAVVRSRAELSIHRLSPTQVCVDAAPLRDLVRELVLKTASPEMRDSVNALHSSIQACDELALTRAQIAGPDSIPAWAADVLAEREERLEDVVAETSEVLYLSTRQAENLGRLLVEASTGESPVLAEYSGTRRRQLVDAVPAPRSAPDRGWEQSVGTGGWGAQPQSSDTVRPGGIPAGAR